MRYFLICFLLFFALSGCAAMPPPNFSVPNVGPSQHKLNAELKSITVVIARPDEKTGELPVSVGVFVPLWKSALEDALNRMAIFKDDARKKVSLAVKILKFDPPSFGADMTTTAGARYELLDREDGSVIYTSDIETDGVCPFDYAFVGATRAVESWNRAVQNNISKFLMQLETVDIGKPMFPTNASSTAQGKQK